MEPNLLLALLAPKAGVEMRGVHEGKSRLARLLAESLQYNEQGEVPCPTATFMSSEKSRKQNYKSERCEILTKAIKVTSTVTDMYTRIAGFHLSQGIVQS